MSYNTISKKTIILASNNKHKIEEFRSALVGYNVLSLSDIGFFDDIDETGTTFQENSLIKTKAIYNFLKDKGISALIVADDSGLCVDALGGAPGVYSARYSGDHDDAANRKKLLEEMHDKSDRNAHFTCLITLMYPDGTHKFFEGICNGIILDHEDGTSDFGYNNLFYSYNLGKTFGNANIEERTKENHRGKAIEKLKKELGVKQTDNKIPNKNAW